MKMEKHWYYFERSLGKSNAIHFFIYVVFVIYQRTRARFDVKSQPYNIQSCRCLLNACPSLITLRHELKRTPKGTNESISVCRGRGGFSIQYSLFHSHRMLLGAFKRRAFPLASSRLHSRFISKKNSHRPRLNMSSDEKTEGKVTATQQDIDARQEELDAELQEVSKTVERKRNPLFFFWCTRPDHVVLASLVGGRIVSHSFCVLYNGVRV